MKTCPICGGPTKLFHQENKYVWQGCGKCEIYKYISGMPWVLKSNVKVVNYKTYKITNA